MHSKIYPALLAISATVALSACSSTALRGAGLQAVQRYRWEAVRDTLLAAYHDALHAPAQSMRPVA